MAGFLTPQISEVGGVQGIPIERGVPDTSVGDALKNVSSIFDAVISSGAREEGTVGTQTDRDRAAMQKYTQDFKRLGKLVRSGQMSSSEAQARGTSLLLEATALFPDKTTQLKDFASAVLGTEVFEPSEDPMQQARDAVFTEIANSDDPQMMRIARKALQESGGDQGRYESAALRLFAEKNAKDARTADLLDEVQRAEAIGKLDKAREDQISEVKFNDYTQEVNDRVEETMLALAGAGEQINISDALQTVIALKAELKAEILPEVAELRIADNFKTKYGGVDAVLAPLTNLENQLRNMRQEDLDAAKARATLAPDRLAKILTDAGISGVFAHTEAGQQYITETLLFQKLEGINVSEVEITRAEQMLDNPFYEKTGGRTGVDDRAGDPGVDTLINDDGTSAYSASNKEEAKRMVNSGIASFIELGTRKNPTEEDKKFAVEDFVIGLGAMNNKALTFDEASFDRLYGNDQFFKVFDKVHEEGGRNAVILQKGVSQHLNGQRLNKEADVNADLGAVEELPGTQLVFDGEKYTVQLSRIPRTEAEEAVLNMLEEAGLPRTLEGVKQLQAPRATLPRGVFEGRGETPGKAAAFRAIPQLIDQTRDNLRLLNKVIGATKRLPEEVQGGVLPTGQGAITTNVIEVEGEEEMREKFDAAPNGTVFEWKNTDGSIGTGLKINGQLRLQ